MSTLAEIEAAAERLPAAEVKRLVQHLTLLLKTPPQPISPKARISNLHPGAMRPAADFDDPLPDEFWLGKNA